jgi:tetratricopeptide (TPR) repeat protein
MIVERVRALLVVACAAAIALVIARRSIADSLVVRGDTFLYKSEPTRALAYYRRAMSIDSADDAAIDHFAFAALIGRDASVERVALEACSKILLQKPNDWTVRFDRALLFRSVGELQRAEEDFAAVGRAKRDPRIMAFAGFSARSLGRQAQARQFFQTALRFSADFQPARRALDREHQVR